MLYIKSVCHWKKVFKKTIKLESHLYWSVIRICKNADRDAEQKPTHIVQFSLRQDLLAVIYFTLVGSGNQPIVTSFRDVTQPVSDTHSMTRSFIVLFSRVSHRAGANGEEIWRDWLLGGRAGNQKVKGQLRLWQIPLHYTASQCGNSSALRLSNLTESLRQEVVLAHRAVCVQKCTMGVNMVATGRS